MHVRQKINPTGCRRRREQSVITDAVVLEQRGGRIEGDVLIAGARIWIADEDRKTGIAIGGAGAGAAGAGQNEKLTERILRRRALRDLNRERLAVGPCGLGAEDRQRE